MVNTSATLPAALAARRADGTELELHLSTPLPGAGDDRWVVELRAGDGARSAAARAGERLALPGGAPRHARAPYLAGARLWVAALDLPEPLTGLPRPPRARRSATATSPTRWPLEAYQTVYATEPGSAEMPSAGRPFTPSRAHRAGARGVAVAPIVLHTGVSSLERGERPYPERFRVPAATARLVDATRGWGGRVVAVGTTVVRALETVARADGDASRRAGLDRARHHPRARRARGRRPAHRLARARGLAPGHARGDRRARRSSSAPTPRRSRPATCWHEFGDST